MKKIIKKTKTLIAVVLCAIIGICVGVSQLSYLRAEAEFSECICGTETDVHYEGCPLYISEDDYLIQDDYGNDQEIENETDPIIEDENDIENEDGQDPLIEDGSEEESDENKPDDTNDSSEDPDDEDEILRALVAEDEYIAVSDIVKAKIDEGEFVLTEEGWIVDKDKNRIHPETGEILDTDDADDKDDQQEEDEKEPEPKPEPEPVIEETPAPAPVTVSEAGSAIQAQESEPVQPPAVQGTVRADVNYVFSDLSSPVIKQDFRFWTVARKPVFAKSELAVFESKTYDAREIGKLPENGLAYMLKSENNGWAYIESGRVRGFVRTENLYIDDEADHLLDELEAKAREAYEKQNKEYVSRTDNAKPGA